MTTTNSERSGRIPMGTAATVTLSARRFYALASAAALSIILVAVLGTLLAIGYNDLRGRLEAVCDPLRFGGEQVQRLADRPAGSAAGRTFDQSADKLGCPRPPK